MVQLHVMEKQFFKQLLQKLDLRFNKDTTSHMSFTMWHELQGWVTSVIVKLKCSAVTAVAPLLNYTAAAHRQGVSDQWQQLTGKSGFCIYLMLRPQAAGTQRLFLSSQIFLLHILRILPTPRVHAVCDRLCIGRSISWHLLSCHDCVWLCDPHKVIMCLTFSRSDLPSKAPSVNGTIYTTFNKQTFTHAVSCCCALNWRALQIWLNPSTLGRFYFLHNRSQPPSELGTSSPSREQSAV